MSQAAADDVFAEAGDRRAGVRPAAHARHEGSARQRTRRQPDGATALRRLVQQARGRRNADQTWRRSVRR